MSDGQTISYTFDGVQMSSLSLATVETLLGGTSFAYWGLTGATDILSEQEQVRLVKMEATGGTAPPTRSLGRTRIPSRSTTRIRSMRMACSRCRRLRASSPTTTTPTATRCAFARSRASSATLLLLAPTNGTVTMNEDGSFTYTPNAGFAGVDSFYYCTQDGPACVQGRVDITVTGTGTGINTILGTSADDVLVGTAGNDLMLRACRQRSSHWRPWQ